MHHTEEEAVFDGVKVFSATKHEDRMKLGETVTSWLRKNPGVKVFDYKVNQSSDSSFHCLSITLFYTNN